MSISLCMIVKNEEDNLATCLESVSDFVDEMVIVDTGSTDETIYIAKSYGAKIYQYEWNDSFADARNYSLSKATREWILIMDGDDQFEREDKNNLLSITENKASDTDVFCCKTLCYSGSMPDNSNVLININVRLIKNHMGYKFNGRIHEQIIYNYEKCDFPHPIMTADIRFYHYGYLTSNITKKDKHKRNIGLIQKELDEKPEDLFMLFNMGNEYLALEEPQKALDFYMRSFKKFDSQQGFSSMLLTRIILCNERLHIDADAFKFIKLGLEYYPQITDFEYLKASMLLQQKKIEEAIRSYKKCIKMGIPPANVISDVGVATFKPHYFLSTIYVVLGNTSKALFHCTKALQYDPTFRDAFVAMADLLRKKGSAPMQIKKRFLKIIPDTADSYLMLSDIFYNRKWYQQALELILQAKKLSPENPAIDYYEGICQFYLKKYKQAYDCLLKSDADIFASKSAFFCMLCIAFDNTHTLTVPTELKAKIDLPYYRIATAYRSLAAGGKCEPICDDVFESQKYVKPTFDLLEILLKTERLEEFQKALQLLKLLTSNKVFLLLGKMYYRNGYPKLAYYELSRSIKLTDSIDAEGLEIMKDTIRTAHG